MSQSSGWLTRVREPVSEDPGQEAILYSELDHSEVNQQFVDDLLAGGPVGRQIVDLGCGPAEIPIRLAEQLQANPEWMDRRNRGPDESDSMVDGASEFQFRGFQIMGIDSEVEMLQIAKREIDIAGFIDQILLECADLDELELFDSNMADTVISNSVIHHLRDPARGIATAHRLARPSGRVFHRDLARPINEEALEELVAKHGGSGGEAASQLLRQSLHASITIDEVREALRGLGVDESSVQMTSDRHRTIDYIKS